MKSYTLLCTRTFVCWARTVVRLKALMSLAAVMHVDEPCCVLTYIYIYYINHICIYICILYIYHMYIYNLFYIIYCLVMYNVYTWHGLAIQHIKCLVDWRLADLFCIEFACCFQNLSIICRIIPFSILFSTFCLCEAVVLGVTMHKTLGSGSASASKSASATSTDGSSSAPHFGDCWLQTDLHLSLSGSLYKYLNYLKSYFNTKSMIWSHINQHHINDISTSQ